MAESNTSGPFVPPAGPMILKRRKAHAELGGPEAVHFASAFDESGNILGLTGERDRALGVSRDFAAKVAERYQTRPRAGETTAEPR